MQKKIIVLDSQYGRLGNKLWTHANVLGYAMKYNFTVYNPSLRKTSNIFTSSQDKKIINKLLPGLSRINNKINIFPSLILENGQLLNLDDIDLRDLSKKKVFFLHGLYFYAPQCVQEFATQIRKRFVPDPLILNRIQVLFNQAKDKSDIVIGVHIRQGDYRYHSGGIMFYELSEYVNIMRSLKEQLPNQRVSFIICSDEPQNLSLYSDLDLIPGHGGIIEDLYTLAHCDFIFGPNSTFSHWASFWGGVPLHILDYKAQSIYGLNPIFKPQLDLHFEIFNPKDFGKFARSYVTLDQVVIKKILNFI